MEISEQPSILKSKVSQVHPIRVMDLGKCFLGGLSPEKGHVDIHQVRFQVKSCCCSGAKSCLTLCDPMNCSRPSFAVLHCLREFAQKVMSLESVMPSNHLILCHTLLLLPSTFQHQGLVQEVSFSHQVAKGLVLQLQHQFFQ